jgi:hypothetical protein
VSDGSAVRGVLTGVSALAERGTIGGVQPSSPPTQGPVIYDHPNDLRAARVLAGGVAAILVLAAVWLGERALADDGSDGDSPPGFEEEGTLPPLTGDEQLPATG